MRTFVVTAGCCLLLAGCEIGASPRSSSSPSTATSASTSPTPTPSPSVLAAPKDGTNLKACADATCEVIIKGRNRLAMAKKFGVVGLDLAQTPGRLDFYVDRSSGDNTGGWIGGTGHLTLAEGITITVERNDRSGALLRFTPGK